MEKVKKVNKKDSRLWHIAKKYAHKRVGSPTMCLKPTKLSEDGMTVTLIDLWTNREMHFNMERLRRFLGVPAEVIKYEFNDLPHKGE